MQNLNKLFSNQNRKNLIMGSLVFGAALIGLWATFSWLPFWIQNLVSGTSGQKRKRTCDDDDGRRRIIGRIYFRLGRSCIGIEKNPADLFRCQFYFGVHFIQAYDNTIAGHLSADCIHNDLFWDEPGRVVHVYSGTLSCFTECYGYWRLF